MKTCTKCKKSKPLTEFYKAKATKDGRTYTCADCNKRAAKKYRKAHPEKARAQTLRWQAANPKKVKGYAAKSRKKSRSRPEFKDRDRDSRYRSRYGITLADYDQMWADQNGKCAICDRERQLDVDHDHDTGEVRGLLCRSCNMRLHAFENVEWRDQAMTYLGLRVSA